jgi:phosphatidylserine decarboxylase
LVAGIRLHCLEGSHSLRQRGANVILCDSHFHKGEEMGWFEHGSTILVFAPKGFSLCGGICEGATIRMGEPLMRMGESA